MLDDKLKMRVGEAASCCVSPTAQPSAICGSKTNRNKTERRKQANNRKLELEMLVPAISNLLQKKEGRSNTGLRNLGQEPPGNIHSREIRDLQLNRKTL